MSKRSLRFLIVSDFNANIFKGYFNNDSELPRVEATIAPFSQVIPTLVGENMECWRRRPDYAIVWTQPESVIPSFKSVLSYQPVAVDEIVSEVDEFSRILNHLQERVSYAFIPTWVLPSYHRGYGMLEMKNGVGITNILMRMNLRLADNLEEAPNICLVNTQRWIESAGQNAFNPKLWYMGKVAFGNEVFKSATKDIKSALRGISGLSKKLIIVDLDDTLWGGIVGDVGWKNLNLGGHNATGEAFVDFQHALKSLTNRGVLLAIVSKNTESLALEAIRNHPEMVLRLEDFVGWKINWDDKAKNIVALISDLNLGLQSVVFVDDSPFERARVREALPEVFVPEWPSDKMLYKAALLNLRCFDTTCISDEDLKRTQMYLSEGKRKDLRRKIKSFDEWLKDLRIKVTVEDLNEGNIQRVVQLLNRTNQMNLSTRRMTESELMSWASQENNKLWTFRVSDKFGDSGLTGMISLEAQDNRGKIADFVLSCRVMGRRVEETMLYVVFQYAKSIGAEKIMAQYIPTEKNKPCLEFWKESGLEVDEKGNCFSWKTKDSYILPTYVDLCSNLAEGL